MKATPAPGAGKASAACEHLLRLAAAAGWPALKTRRGEVPAGEAAWREFAARAGYFALGAAEVALLRAERRTP